VLAQKGTRVIGHVEFSLARLCFEGGSAPVALLRHLAMLPEHARPGLAAALLAEAEEKARGVGAAAAIFGGPGEPIGPGWRPLPAERRWLAPAARLVARLESLRKGTLDARPRPLIRPWRLVELDALMRIYSARAAHRSGACFRDEACWNWLLNRQAHDRIYLALEGQDRGSFEDISGRVRAYLTLRGRQVVEVAAERGHEEALLDLLTRACGDALEETAPLLAYVGAADDPLGALFGWAAEHAAGHALPQRWIKPLAPEGRPLVEALTRSWRPPVWDELESE
jgi:hypothetical protein